MRNNRVYGIVLIVGWSFLVHLPGITSPLLDYQAYRQCQTASMARNYVRHGMHFLSPEVDTEGPPVRAGTEFPLYSYLLALLFRVLGIHEFLGRLLSCLFAAWGAVFLYLFVRPRLGDRVAVWSGLFLCAIPVHVYFTRSVQPEPMALWGVLGFLFFADDWLRDQARWGSWIGALVLGAVAPLLKLNFLYVLGPLWLFLGYDSMGLAMIKRPSWLGLLALILIFTAAWYHYAKTAAVIILPLTAQEQWVNLAPVFTRRLWQAQFISRVPELVTTYGGLLLASAGIYHGRREKSLGLFFWWIPVSVVYVVLLGEYGMIHRYTLLPLAPPAAVWAAYGLVILWDRVKTSPGLRALLVVVLASIPLHAAFRIKHWYHIDFPFMDDARQTVAAASRPNDLVLVSTHDKPVILYYVDRYGYSIGPADWTPPQVDQYISRGVRFIFIPTEDNPRRLMEWKSTLTQRGTLVKEEPGYWLYRMEGSTARSRQG